MRPARGCQPAAWRRAPGRGKVLAAGHRCGHGSRAQQACRPGNPGRGQQAAIARLQAQKRGDSLALEAAIARLQAQLSGDTAAQEATIQRLAGELEGNVQAQQATIDRLYAELDNAQTEYWRHQQLYQEGAISQSLFDAKRLAVQTGQDRVKEAEAILRQIRTIGQEKINEAQVTLTRIMQTGNKQIEEAKANLERIQKTSNAELAQAQTNFNRIR